MSLADAVSALTGAYEGVTLLVLMASAMIEYVFPPFPGDTVTLAGAMLITVHGWSFWPPFAAVLIGGMAGAAVDFWFGRWLGQEGRAARVRWAPLRKAIAGMGRASARFARHGEAYIVINRFLPGIRGFLFVAAGMAGMRFGRVMGFALLSGTLWNLAVIGVGMLVGANIERLEALARDYTLVVWLLLALFGLFAIARWWWRGRPRRPADPD